MGLSEITIITLNSTPSQNIIEMNLYLYGESPRKVTARAFTLWRPVHLNRLLRRRYRSWRAKLSSKFCSVLCGWLWGKDFSEESPLNFWFLDEPFLVKSRIFVIRKCGPSRGNLEFNLVWSSWLYTQVGWDRRVI